jgi:hypothetical protein
MNKRRALRVAALAAGVATLLLWLWQPSGAPTIESLPPADPGRPASDRSALAPAASARLGRAAADAALSALLRTIARGEARPAEALFNFPDDDSLRRFLARAPDAGLTLSDQIPALRAVRVRFSDPAALAQGLRQLGADGLSPGANSLIGVPLPPSKENRAAVDQVPFGNEALAFLGAAGDRSSWGRGTTIAILDTGVASDATFGAGRIRTLDVGFGTTPGRAEADGHGTAVAALAAGASPNAPGIAPAANLLSIRVTDSSSTSDLFTLSQAIVTAVDAGAKIINISLGGYATGPTLDAAITYASQRGALIVAAAGNDQAAQLAWPAADPRVISVGAVDRAEQQVSFSNSGTQLQLSAPGYGIQTAWLDGQRVTVDGTSASAPFVAGALATVLSQNPGLTAVQAAAILTDTANDTGQPGADPAYGNGILNLGTALNRDNPSYTDTAISSHYYDQVREQMQFVVQNRSGAAVSGLTLSVTVDSANSVLPIPRLAAGETYVASVPVSAASLRTAGTMSFGTQLNNPAGTNDAVPKNNRRSSQLTAPGSP